MVFSEFYFFYLCFKIHPPPPPPTNISDDNNNNIMYLKSNVQRVQLDDDHCHLMAELMSLQHVNSSSSFPSVCLTSHTFYVALVF